MKEKEVMGQIIFTNNKGVCWKIAITADMRLVEVLECIEQQFNLTQMKDKKKKKLNLAQRTYISETFYNLIEQGFLDKTIIAFVKGCKNCKHIRGKKR